jgi:hypothetical protein
LAPLPTTPPAAGVPAVVGVFDVAGGFAFLLLLTCVRNAAGCVFVVAVPSVTVQVLAESGDFAVVGIFTVDGLTPIQLMASLLIIAPLLLSADAIFNFNNKAHYVSCTSTELRQLTSRLANSGQHFRK